MTVIDETYLPFEGDTLMSHFASIGGEPINPRRHLAHYEKSVAASVVYRDAAEIYSRALRSYAKNKNSWKKNDPVHAAHKKLLLAEKRKTMLLARPLGKQMEKDERFWVAAALMNLYHSTDRVRLFADLLSRAIGESPVPSQFATWEQALGNSESLHLYFEVNLPSPKSYQEELRPVLSERSLIPHLHKLASASPTSALEGATKIDAMLISSSTNVAVAFEAKVLSDVSTQIRYDALRNQLARNIDVLLDRNPNVQSPLKERSPERTYLVLLTPEIFRQNPETRLYGWLMNEYRKDAQLLAKHLPHRSPAELQAASERLGWLTWEDCNQALACSCPWLCPEGEGESKEHVHANHGPA
jgi:hypothetical protein